MVDEKAKVSLKDVPKEDIMAGLALLEKEKDRKRRIASGEIKGGQKWSELSPEVKKKRLEGSKKYRIRQQLLLKKAQERGIQITDEEINAAMAGEGK